MKRCPWQTATRLALLALLTTACSVFVSPPSAPLSKASEHKSINVEAAEISLQVTATASPLPSASPVPTPSPDPRPVLKQLTGGNCCVQPFFAPSGGQVLFIDKPSSDAIAGIYGVDLNSSEPVPVLVNETIGFRNPGRTIMATLEGSLARFVDEATGKSWAVDTGGNQPHYSPDSSQILWTATDREGPYDRRRTDIWLATLEGINPRRVISLVGGAFAGWLPDGQRIGFLTRDNPNEEERTLFIYDLATEQRIDLAREKRIRQVEISSAGSWIAYFITFTDNPAGNGLWVARSDGSVLRKLNTPGFGAYRWRDDNHLLYIPMRASTEESMQLWEINVEANESRPLTDPTLVHFSISNGDWAVSPDGRFLVFVNSDDQNIWLMTLP